MTGLTIKDIIITPIAVTDPPLLNAAGLHAPYALRTIVEVITHDNIIGISEIPGNSDIDAALEKSREILIGKDPFQLNQIRDAIQDHFETETTIQRGDTPWDQRKIVHVYSAIEVACMDIIGKILERPVVDLLGGSRRDKVPLQPICFINMKAPEDPWVSVRIRMPGAGTGPGRLKPRLLTKSSNRPLLW